jgi:hypothetical protein
MPFRHSSIAEKSFFPIAALNLLLSDKAFLWVRGQEDFSTTLNDKLSWASANTSPRMINMAQGR